MFAAVAGARIAEVPIENIERPHGKSNYGLARTLNVLIDLVFLYFFVRYLNRPCATWRGIDSERSRFFRETSGEVMFASELTPLAALAVPESRIDAHALARHPW